MLALNPHTEMKVAFWNDQNGKCVAWCSADDKEMVAAIDSMLNKRIDRAEQICDISHEGLSRWATSLMYEVWNEIEAFKESLVVRTYNPNRIWLPHSLFNPYV